MDASGVDFSEADDTLSLRPGEEESLSGNIKTPEGHIQDFSDFSSVDDLDEADAEEMLHTLAEVNGETFPNVISSSEALPYVSVSGYSREDDSFSTEAPSTSSSSEPQQSSSVATTTTDDSYSDCPWSQPLPGQIDYNTSRWTGRGAEDRVCGLHHLR